MAQTLIVEGKDSYVLSSILIKRGLKPPKGYENKQKFKDFVIEAGGFSRVKNVFKQALLNEENTNIGVVIDCDEENVQELFEGLVEIIKERESINLPENLALSNEGFVHQFTENLTIGIWIMPNNENNGYLEHFLEKLIPKDDDILPFAKEKIKELKRQPFNVLTDIRTQKALIHTWLAWQKEPGHPIGLAVNAGYFNANSPNADAFANWFQKTFELS